MAGSSLTPKDHLEANNVGVVVVIGKHLLIASGQSSVTLLEQFRVWRRRPIARPPVGTMARTHQASSQRGAGCRI